MGGIFIVKNGLNGLEQSVKKTVLWTVVSPRPARASPTRGAKGCRPWLCVGGIFIVGNGLNGLEQGVKKTVLWTVVSPRPAGARPIQTQLDCAFF
jgi:hypothetical protein